ncbi:unnamed protein product [Rotaria socialis]|uniref:Iodothyronine deiodinase n=1 Tax=Rotaria socialis TaxID=392032 RepID=A0A818BLK0_9BILA|nr:unnamed protein product [Rotaria socialis]CAF4922653.1 unnamed protein product [Rotaria socialis]
MDVIADLQMQLVREAIGEYTTEDEIQCGLRIFRSAHQLYANDNEFHNLSFYVRHNRAKQGNLRVGDEAIDIQLLNMNGEFKSLLSYFNPNRPLLILAGSYTWPPFRGLVPQLNELMDFYQNQGDMITVYIEEAHAADEWPIGSRISTGYRIPLLIDPVSEKNPFSQVYSPWPIRFYVIDHMKKFSYIAQPIQGSFPLELIKNALNKVIRKTQQS